MIYNILYAPLDFLITTLVPIIPDSIANSPLTLPILKALSFGIYFIGIDYFIKILLAVSGWWYVQLIWAIFEWIYKKIPGIN
ncbi:hypothetical protein FACS1894188_01250 [Clostridia bacterium]|nr:hypothetical protein FACS1894188_01250 [Clostridia bacterium]